MNWLRCYTLENLTYNSENDTYNKQQLHVTRNNIVTNSKNLKELKHKIREEMNEHGINHVTIEIENDKEICDDESCNIKEERTNSNSKSKEPNNNHYGSSPCRKRFLVTLKQSRKTID